MVPFALLPDGLTRRPLITDCNYSWATWLLNNNYIEPVGFGGRHFVSFFIHPFVLRRPTLTGWMLPNPRTSYARMILILCETSAGLIWGLGSTPELSVWPRFFLLNLGECFKVSNMSGCGIISLASRDGRHACSLVVFLFSHSRSQKSFFHKSSPIEARLLSHSVWQRPNWPPVNSLLNPIWGRESASFGESYKTDQLL